MPQPYRLRPGVKALIVQDGKVLVIKEKVLRDGVEKILHDFPGGGIEPGETLIDGLQREVWEEIHAKITVGSVVGAWDFFLDYDIEDPVQIICIGYQCELDGESEFDFTQNPAEEEIFEASWMSLDELCEVFAYSPGMLAAVENVRW